MSSTLILPDFTEIGAIREKLDMLRDFNIIPAGDKIQKITKIIYLDLTFDFFNKNITPSYLFGFFADMEPVMNFIDTDNTSIVCLRNYSFRTNIKNLLQKQRILDYYINILTEFFNARIIFVPTIISRHSFQNVQNPPVQMINAMRLDNSENIKIRKNSRFIIIYDRDMIEIFMHPENEIKKNLILDGLELSLEEIYVQTVDYTGAVPITYDPANFINYEYPELPADNCNYINYDFKNMIMDITSFLF